MLKTKHEIIIELNQEAERIAKEHPADYHRLQEFRDLVDMRSSIQQEPEGEITDILGV